jgi:hypothetical protein
MNVQSIRTRQMAGLPTRPRSHVPLTRRQFLKVGTATAAAAMAGNLGRVNAAGVLAAPLSAQPGDPRPIPYGTPLLFPNPTIFHVEAPGYPLPNPPFDTNPATNNPATITDFNGFVGLVYVGGYGTHHDLQTDQTKRLYWEVDMRFMVGEYVGLDGRHHHGTIGFV